ncbi:Chain length determinant protein [compost metagenome]
MGEVSMTSYEDEIDLADLWKAIWRRKALVLVMTLVAGLVGLFAAMFQPKVYVAEATVLPSRLQNDAAELLAAGVAAQAGPMEALLGGFSATKAPDLVGVLKSRVLAERVMRAYDLEASYKQLFGGDGAHDQVEEMVKIVSSSRANAVAIQVKAPDPKLAATLANGYVAELQGALDEFARQTAQKKFRVIEAQLLKTRQDLSAAAPRTGKSDESWLAEQELAVLKTNYQNLLKQREAAILAERKGADDFLPLDEAKIPTKPQSAQLGLFAGLSLLVGLMLGIFAALYAERATLFSKAVRQSLRA